MRWAARSHSRSPSAASPQACLPEVVASVNRAAAAVVAACGGSLAGGHSIRCDEPVFGLCVIGFVHSARIWRKSGARAGDALVLSKPLGTGVLVSSGEPEALLAAVASMRVTNQQAALALQALPEGPHAVTDVSGYGLLGHAGEMAAQSSRVLRLDAARVPLLEGALRLARRGVRTSMHRRGDSRHAAAALHLPPSLDPALLALLQDPQTSGGLLAAVAPQDVAALQRAGFQRVGNVLEGEPAVTLD